MDSQLLTFPLDIEAVLKHLRQDMKDDWFSDPLCYKDIFDRPDHVKSVIEQILILSNGRYSPDGRYAYDVPKANLGLRYSLETDFYDRFMYQALCSYLMPFFDPLLSNRVLGHRYNPEREKEKYIFKNRIDLWNTFEGITYAELNTGKTILCTDLINYFENIRIDQIVNSLLQKLEKVKASGTEKVRLRNAITTLDELLRRWCYKDTHGLPQNRDASSFLANIVLDAVDQTMVDLGHDYFRYVDDIRIVCNDEYHAKRTLNLLIKELRTVGMNINSSKTKIITPLSPTEQVVDYFPAKDDRTQAIDNMWKSRSRRVITRSIPILLNLIGNLIIEAKTQSRQFRFCINRLKMLMETNLFSIQNHFTEQFKISLLELLEIQPVSTDQFFRIVELLDARNPIFQKIEEFLLNENISLYAWQNFHLWLLLAYKKHSAPDLLAKARSKIEKDPSDADVPAIFIFLARNGHFDELKAIIPKFSSDWPYQHKRLFLISTQNMEKSDLAPMRNLLGIKLAGTQKRIVENGEIKDGMFYRDVSRSVLDLYDRISSYD